MSKTIYKTEYWELYQDKNGKFWLWDELSKSNRATRAKTELDAYRQAVGLLVFSCDMQSSYRNEAESKLTTLQDAFEKVFPSEEV